jgi:hypothetical protein
MLSELCHEKKGEVTNATHELKNGRPSLLKQIYHLLEALKHGLVISDGLGHSTRQAISQRVFDVEFARGARSQECVIQTYYLFSKSRSKYASPGPSFAKRKRGKAKD